MQSPADRRLPIAVAIHQGAVPAPRHSADGEFSTYQGALLRKSSVDQSVRHRPDRAGPRLHGAPHSRFFRRRPLMHDVLANGAKIPAIGFGTYGMARAEMLRMIPAECPIRLETRNTRSEHI